LNSGATAPPTPRRLFLLLYVAPVLLLLAVRALPLATGSRTLYLRDVFGTHLEMKAAQAEAMRAGRLPLIDPYRAGGQPALGNPDSVPLYPDNLLYLAAPPLWALNAHLWIHLLLAPFGMYWLGRAWGLRREAAWAAGTFYALSGYVLSHLTLYNQIAGAALAPALAAACLRFAEGHDRRRSGPAVAILWALLLLGGEPFMALLALLLALSSVAVRQGVRRESFFRLGLPLLCGTMIAAPQIVELARIIGSSYRGHLGYSIVTRTAASWDPRQAVEWLIPFAFGRPDLLGAGGFWGHRFFTGHPPYYFSLYPGLLALALVVAALRGGGRSVRWPLLAAATGLFLALGRFNPAVAWIFEAGAGLVRYPVRMWLLSAIGGALLAGIGFERCFLEGDRSARRWLLLTLGALAGAFLLGRLAIALVSAPLESWVIGILPGQSQPGSAAAAVSRWADLCLISLALVALLGLACALAGRLPRKGGALVLALHAAAQIALLAPLMASDAMGPYLAPSPLVEAIPPGAAVAHGGAEGLFGAGSPAPRLYPGGEAYWFARRDFLETYPFAGALWGRRYELNVSSEGLDSFLSTAARDAVRLADDAGRLRLLAAWGVEYLILDRPLDPVARDQVEPVRRLSSFGGSIDLYRIPAAAPWLLVATTVRRAPSLNAAVAALKDPSFDPRTMVVLPGSGSAIEAAPGLTGTSRPVESGPESLAAEVETGSPGVLVIQRAWLPLYRASLDGAEVAVRVANLHHIGVDVPAGRHRVDLWVDRRPLRVSLLVSLLGLCGLAVLARRPGLVGTSVKAGQELPARMMGRPTTGSI
jgi:hypothetical protein